MRTMCVTVVFIIFISDRQKGLASQAGFHSQREEAVESLESTRPSREGGVSDQYTTGVVEKQQRKTTHRKSEFLRTSLTKHYPSTAKKQQGGTASDSDLINSGYKILSKLPRNKSNKDMRSSKSARSKKSRNSYYQNGEHHEIRTVPYPEMSVRNTPRTRKIWETRSKVRQRRTAERTLSWPKPWGTKRRRRTAHRNQITDGSVSRTEFTGKVETRNNQSKSRAQNQKGSLASPGKNQTVGIRQNILSRKTGVEKVVLLILFTFPPGVLAGYFCVASIFCWRNKRCLCCTEGCETAVSKFTGLGTPSPKKPKPRLSLVNVSERGSVVEHQPSLNDPSDRKLLEQQFDEDRRYFLQYGKDPACSSSVDDVVQFKDNSNLSKKAWLRERLKWWLQKDRYRSLSGMFTDPSGPPDVSPPASYDKHDGLKSEVSEFTSVSQLRPSREKTAGTSSSVKAKLRKKFLRTNSREAAREEMSEATSASGSSYTLGGSESSADASEFEKEYEKELIKDEEKETDTKGFEKVQPAERSTDTKVSADSGGAKATQSL